MFTAASYVSANKDVVIVIIGCTVSDTIVKRRRLGSRIPAVDVERATCRGAGACATGGPWSIRERW